MSTINETYLNNLTHPDETTDVSYIKRCLKAYCDEQDTCEGCVFNWDEPCRECEYELVRTTNNLDSSLRGCYTKLYQHQEYNKGLNNPFLEEPQEEPKEPTEDLVNHPSHYTHGGMECIDEMLMIFGREAVMYFCLCNAWKYRKRCLYKNQEEDMKKSDWYINKYKELKYGTEPEQPEQPNL